MDVEASFNSRHHDFGRFQSRGLCLIRKKMDFRCISAPASFRMGWHEHTSGVFERILMLIWKIYVWFWGRIGICSVCCLTTSSTEKNRQEKPEDRWRGPSHVMKWSWLTQLQLNVALVCPPGSLHIFAVFVFAHSLIALSKSKLPIWWCCYYPIIGPILRMRTTPKTSQVFFLQLRGVRFDPGYGLSCGWQTPAFDHWQ